MKKALIVVTNVSKYENINRPTGLWLGEVVHFVDELYKKGFEIDYVSPNGGYAPIDPSSLAKEVMTDLDWIYYQNQEFLDKLGFTLSPTEIVPEDYEIIYYAGGHGVMWDFKSDKNLQKIASDIYMNNGIISAVCHGVVGLLDIKSDKDNYLIKNKKVTGFSNSEEYELGLSDFVPYLTEDSLKERNAIYSQGKNWHEFSVQDDRVVTGQNPQSGKAVAKKVLSILNTN